MPTRVVHRLLFEAADVYKSGIARFQSICVRKVEQWVWSNILCWTTCRLESENQFERKSESFCRNKQLAKTKIGIPLELSF